MPGRTAAVEEARLSRTLSALSDPTRRAIVSRLAKGSASAGQLAEPFSIGLPTVSLAAGINVVGMLVAVRLPAR
jgi:DNA-binding transcriptional ArsR family regulator